MGRRRVVAVVGSARVEDALARERIRRLGERLISGGFRLVTGGLGGTMALASEGARRSTAWREGMVVGVVPSYRHDEANVHCDIVVPSGLQVGRNLVVVAMADVVVAVGGGAGTLSEIALAWQLRRPVVALGGDGWAGRLAGERLDGRQESPVHAAATVAEAVGLCRQLANRPSDSHDIEAS